MKIEDVINANVKMDAPKKAVLNIIYTQNVLHESFNEILKAFDLSGEQYNVLRILRGQKGCPDFLPVCIQGLMFVGSSI